ncbi:acyltransferase [Pseudomonas sp. Z1-29]|uniref:acyltransferase family protein n=1 Tax=Pseudomonas sp. Z1-29 TaxID=2817410 RepID=UPI003DA83561
MGNNLTLQNIQSLRWLAAALVFMQHSIFFAGQTTGDSMMSFRGYNFGGIGVYVFFIISGFVIAMQTEKKPLQFLLHRAFRIYPAYFSAVALSFVILYLFSTQTPSLNTDSLSMLLIPTGTLNSSFQIPYWTLIYEIFFYSLILLLMVILKGRQSLIDGSILIWLAVVIFTTQMGLKLDIHAPSLKDIIFSPMNIYFMCGYFLSRVLLSNDNKIAFSGLLIIAASGSFFLSVRYQATVCALGVCAIVFFAKSKPFKKAINKLGDYSYGIYLIHLPMIYCIFLAMKGAGANFSISLSMMVLIALPISIGFGKLEHMIYNLKIRPALNSFIADNKFNAIKSG